MTTNPQLAIAAAALTLVVPSAATGALMAKYTPGVSEQAAMSAITATNDSMSIAPYPIIRASVSRSINLGVVPDAMRA